MVKKRVFILIGPPGSGKGTQASLLQKKLNLTHLSSGQILRQEVQRKTALGRKVASFLDKGLLVPDKLLTGETISRLKSSRKSVVLDGFPRNLNQVKILDRFLAADKAQDIVLEINLSDKAVFERIGGRRDCVCGKIYHIKFDPPKREGICDVCGRKLQIRSDAKLDVVRRRLKTYHKTTKQILDFYKRHKNYIFRMIDGEKSIRQIQESLIKTIKAIK